MLPMLNAVGCWPNREPKTGVKTWHSGLRSKHLTTLKVYWAEIGIPAQVGFIRAMRLRFIARAIYSLCGVAWPQRCNAIMQTATRCSAQLAGLSVPIFPTFQLLYDEQAPAPVQVNPHNIFSVALHQHQHQRERIYQKEKIPQNWSLNIYAFILNSHKRVISRLQCFLKLAI